MHYTKFTKSDFLLKLDSITSYSMKVEEVKDAVSGYGYDQARLKEGREMWERLRVLYYEARDKSVQKSKCHAEKKRMQNDIHKKYMKYLKLARVAFVNDIEAQEALVLTGVRARTYDKWFTQVSVFVNNLKSNEQYLRSIGEYGVKISDLDELKKGLLDITELSDKCVRITAVVRMLNDKVRKETIEVQHWVSSYLKVARIALEGSPEMMNLLGQSDKN
ncbi:hypothetical protein [Plebeiibacterium marinum]|uniref:Uncharacterized protein n=1 Tax=Plebeiibacterium marinum TaxID=2992111 RepID=A0AAE3MBK3_9BACT|nr:hypothetical protein [Plebeiobacterium marinum]MCW3804873.1 hypothetical protein [Plebeiobacterium marinum]